MIKIPSLNALKTFEVVYRHLNFKLAADELNVTQSAVAQKIRGLESELGIKLFERHAKGVTLTENGRDYGKRISQAFQIIEEATQSFVGSKQQITISATPTFSTKWLIPKLNEFSECYPDIELQILATERISHFKNDAVDVAIRYGQPPFGAGLNCELLIPDQFIVVASPKLMGNKLEINDFAQLEHFTLLHDAHKLWSNFFQQFNLNVDLGNFKQLRFNQTALAIDAAIAGQGVALVNEVFVRQQLKSGELIKIYEHHLNLGNGFYIVRPNYSEKNDILNEVCLWFTKQANNKNI
jgi:LysR family transcriptional regulator, glycine cleavage system transcriptional activator